MAVAVVGGAAQCGDTEVHGTGWNIDRGGLMAKFPVRIVPGTVVDYVFRTRHGPVAVTGQVGCAEPPGHQIGHRNACREPREHDFASDLSLSDNWLTHGFHLA